MYCLDGARYVELYGASIALMGQFDLLVGFHPVENRRHVLDRCQIPNGFSLTDMRALQNKGEEAREQWAAAVNGCANSGKWIPGDWGYIWNTHPSPESNVYRGENIIYLGASKHDDVGLFTFENQVFRNNGYFWGLRSEMADRIMKLQEFIDMVDDWNEGYPAVISTERFNLKDLRQ